MMAVVSAVISMVGLRRFKNTLSEIIPPIIAPTNPPRGAMADMKPILINE